MSQKEDEVNFLLDTVNDVIRSIPHYLVIQCLAEDAHNISAQLKDNDKILKKAMKKSPKNSNLKKAQMLNNKALKSLASVVSSLKVMDKEDEALHKVMGELHNLKGLGLE